MPEFANPDLEEALQEAGASAKSSRAAARSVAPAIEVIKGLIWLKVMVVVISALVALNIAMLGWTFVLEDRIAGNTASLVELSSGQVAMTRAIAGNTASLAELRHRQKRNTAALAELRRGQEEIISLLRNRSFRSGPENSGS